MLTAAVRILLIASLLAWSPAWCCCAIRALAGEACGDAAEQRLSCCSRDGRSQERATPSCCGVPSNSNCSTNDAEEQTTCRCADRIIEQQRLDTSLKLAAPRVTGDPLAVFSQPQHDQAATLAAFIGSDANLRQWKPPPRTLLAQLCLLIV